MANFEPAFEKMIKNEGGYVLHNVSGDRGGQTYAGIARNFHSHWPGWAIIDNGDMENSQLTQMVRDFYKQQFWDKVKGDDLTNQEVGESIFDFAVNAGVRTASKIAQLVVDASPDGKIGSKSVERLNNIDGEIFVLKFALSKIARYAEICRRNSVQKKFLLGWINRTLGALS